MVSYIIIFLMVILRLKNHTWILIYLC